MLKALPDRAKKDWKSHLPKLAFAYNSTIHKATGYTPFYLLFGRRSVLPIDLAFEQMEVGEGVDRVTHKQFVVGWQRAMEEARKLANANIKKASGYNKKAYDKKAKAVDLAVGDQVLMRNVRQKGGTRKLNSFWEETLFKVIEKRKNLPVYKIQSVKNHRDVRQIHRNLLMKCNELPGDVFEDKKSGTGKKVSKKEVQKNQPARSASNVKSGERKEVEHHAPEEDSAQYSDDSDDEMIIVHQDTAKETQELPGEGGADKNYMD